MNLVANLVDLLVGADLYAEFVHAPADVDFRDAHLERGLAQVHQRGGLHVGNAATHDQHRDENIRCVIPFQGHLDYRGITRQRLHEGIDHAFAFHRHQRSGLAKRHAHLELRGLSGLVAFALGNDVHAVVVGLVEPPGLVAGDPGRCVRIRKVALLVPRDRAHDDVAGHRRLDRAEQAALVVGLALAHRFEFPDFGAALIAVEAADQPLAVREHRAHVELHIDLLLLDRLAAQVEGEHLELQFVL